MTDAAAIEQRDEAIVEALVAGRSVRVVQREFSLTVIELDQALERCFPLDTAARLRTIRGDLVLLDRIIRKFYLRAIAADGAGNAADDAIVAIRAQERKAALLGLDAVQRIDLQVINPPKQPSRHEKIREVIMRLTDGQQLNGGDPPEEERALELLKGHDNGHGNGSAVPSVVPTAPEDDPDPEPDPDPGLDVSSKRGIVG